MGPNRSTAADSSTAVSAAAKSVAGARARTPIPHVRSLRLVPRPRTPYVFDSQASVRVGAQEGRRQDQTYP